MEIHIYISSSTNQKFLKLYIEFINIQYIIRTWLHWRHSKKYLRVYAYAYVYVHIRIYTYIPVSRAT